MSELGTLIAGRYRLVRRIGIGGMGSVWEALDERLQRTVALKLLHVRPGVSEADAQMAKDRAMREARITAKLHHPHAVPVFDVVEHAGQPCLVMQYLPSRSLQDVLLEKGPLSADEVALIGAEVGAALAAAHSAGITHRDVKPANILITDDGSAHITDFGISHALGDATLTSTGMVTGTPAYLAPEVARGGESSFASDVFSLGATLYTAVEGRPPFGTHENAMALLHRVASASIEPPVRAAALTPVLTRMLASQPEDRPSMQDVARWLETLDLSASTPPPVAPTAVVAAATQRIEPVPASPAAASTAALPTTPAPAVVVSPDRGLPGDREPERRRSGGLVLAGVAIALALVALLAFQFLGDDGGPTGPPSATQSAPAASASSAPRTTSATATTTTSQPITPTTTATPTATTARPTTTPPATSPPPAQPTTAELTQALTDYYRLMPNDTEEGWTRLTARYQTTTAGGFDSYERYWDTIDRVAVSDATASPPGTVVATITYTFKDDRVIADRTSYRLVRDGGILKIDSHTVLRSRQL